MQHNPDKDPGGFVVEHYGKKGKLLRKISYNCIPGRKSGIHCIWHRRAASAAAASAGEIFLCALYRPQT